MWPKERQQLIIISRHEATNPPYIYPKGFDDTELIPKRIKVRRERNEKIEEKKKWT